MSQLRIDLDRDFFWMLNRERIPTEQMQDEARELVNDGFSFDSYDTLLNEAMRRLGGGTEYENIDVCLWCNRLYHLEYSNASRIGYCDIHCEFYAPGNNDGDDDE